ncbi:hypothetical protein Tco_1484599 [Tanacetum coccineum]
MLDETDLNLATSYSSVLSGKDNGREHYEIDYLKVHFKWSQNVLESLQILSAEEKDSNNKAWTFVLDYLLHGSELTKDDRESQLYDEFERFCQIKGRVTIHVYYVRFSKSLTTEKHQDDLCPECSLTLSSEQHVTEWR